ncbi:MAG TPA: alpha/beta fold hydrolase, partial [Rhizobiaceae bacterium]
AEFAPIVLVHGVGMSMAFWAAQVAFFEKTRRVIVYDTLGHGRSSLLTEDRGLVEFSDQLLALVDHLGLGAIDLVGHSMGGLVALEFSLTHPDKVRRVVAMNAVFRRSEAQSEAVIGRARSLFTTGTMAGIQPTLDRWFGNPPPPAHRPTAEIVRHALETADPVGYPRAYMIFATSDRRHDGRLSELAMPALFLTGEFDLNSTPDMSSLMAAQAPQGEAVTLPGQRHMMPLVAPDEVNAELDRFFRRIDADRAQADKASAP